MAALRVVLDAVMKNDKAVNMRPKLIISACLCGVPCRYDGKARTVPELAALYERGEALAVCPELDGGLPAPRPPCELVNRRPLTRDGTDCTGAFLAGAERALGLAREHGITLAVLKEKSPSCGGSFIYDGTFSGRLVPGRGLAAELLARHGLTLANEENFHDFI